MFNLNGQLTPIATGFTEPWMRPNSVDRHIYPALLQASIAAAGTFNPAEDLAEVYWWWNFSSTGILPVSVTTGTIFGSIGSNYTHNPSTGDITVNNDGLYNVTAQLDVGRAVSNSSPLFHTVTTKFGIYANIGGIPTGNHGKLINDGVLSSFNHHITSFSRTINLTAGQVINPYITLVTASGAAELVLFSSRVTVIKIK